MTTGAPLYWDVHPDDAVLSLAVSGDRRTLYVGGRFSQIAGAPAAHLAAIDIETGALDPTFKAPAIDDPVKALAVFGNTLYIGGEFHTVGDAARDQIAALDATTGALRDGFVPPANDGGYYQGHTGSESHSGSKDGAIHDLGVSSDGRYLVVGGDFLDIDGHGGLIVLDATTGAATQWQPEMDRPVFGLSMWPGDNRTFFAATGGSGGTLQAFRIDDATPITAPDDDDDDSGRGSRRSRRSSDRSDHGTTEPLWTHRTDGDSTDVAATTERVFLVGHYDYVLGRQHLLPRQQLRGWEGRRCTQPAHLRVRAPRRSPRPWLHRPAEHGTGPVRCAGRCQQPLHRGRLHRVQRPTAARLRAVPRSALTPPGQAGSR